MTEQESKEVALKGNTDMVVMPEGAWEGTDDYKPEDILISKALLMQPLSELVTDGNAQAGEYRDSISGDLFANEKKVFTAVVFDRFMTWVEFEDGKYIRTIPLTHENENLPIQDGNIERNKTYNFYMLPESILEDADAMPVVFSLKRTGVLTAKKMQTAFWKLTMINQPLAAIICEFTAIKKTNDKGTFYVAEFKQGRETTKEERETAYKWHLSLKKAREAGTVKVDDSDEAAKNKGASAAIKPDDDDDDDGDEIPF